MCRGLPNQNAPGVTDQAKEHQETNEHVKQQQAEVPQPPVNTHSEQGFIQIGALTRHAEATQQLQHGLVSARLSERG